MGVQLDAVRAEVKRTIEKDDAEQDWLNRLLGRKAPRPEEDRRWWQFWR
jgi:hypothetical protein